MPIVFLVFKLCNFMSNPALSSISISIVNNTIQNLSSVVSVATK